MFDSGALRHMAGDSIVMQGEQKIQRISIGLTNDSHTWASKHDTMMLVGKLKLSNVLFVPLLKCNLVSIIRLFKDLNCVLTFLIIFMY